jgi:hypothetical protein
MPKIIANNCEMYYELDDFTAPWRPTETLWIHWVRPQSAFLVSLGPAPCWPSSRPAARYARSRSIRRPGPRSRMVS